MQKSNSWYASPLAWVELFALFNLAGLTPDIFLAHKVNYFRAPAEYVPLVFSIVAPIVLAMAIWGLVKGWMRLWSGLGLVVGWLAVLIGIVGLLLHLDSQFFQLWTLASLVYAAPFAAPLAYTGIGLLLIMNRMVPQDSREWPLWVIFLAWGGFVGNFVFSVTDHAQNGFFHLTEWIPVISSALAVGFLVLPLLTSVNAQYLAACGLVMLLQASVGVIGFALHFHADWNGVGPTLLDRIVYGAPVFAPMLFPDLVILAGIGLFGLHRCVTHLGSGEADRAGGAERE
jgi:hypothetical protein